MIENLVIKRLNEEINKKYQTDDGWYFCDKLQESGAVNEEFVDHLDMFYDGTYFIHVGFEVLAHFSLERSIHTILALKNRDKFNEEFARTTIYGYLTLMMGSQMCKCEHGQSSMPMHRSILHFANNIIALEWERAEEIGDALIASLNAENCIIKRGDYEAYGAWFVVELYSKFAHKDINKKRAYYPKDDFSPYDIVLADWDTGDMEQIDIFVTLLATKFLESATIPMNENNESEKRANLEIPHIQLFPYEILTWLKLREKAGLKNPKTFTHPLMNTPIAKMFLDIKEPLPKPTELPYAKELLEKLKEQCPDVEVPEWLEDNTIPKDFLDKS